MALVRALFGSLAKDTDSETISEAVNQVQRPEELVDTSVPLRALLEEVAELRQPWIEQD